MVLLLKKIVQIVDVIEELKEFGCDTDEVKRDVAHDKFNQF